MNKRHISKVPIQSYHSAEMDLDHLKSLKAHWIIKTQLATVDQKVLMILNLYLFSEISKFFRLKDTPPRYRIFLGKRDWEFTTQDFTENKQNWTTMTLHGILYSDYHYRHSALDSQQDLDLLGQYFGFRFDPSWTSYISRFQREVIKRRRLDKNKEWISEIDLCMAEVPRQLPEDFGRWIQRDVLYRSRYIYYIYNKKKKGKGQEGYCTHCRKQVLVDGALHRKEGECPNCGSRIKFLCESKAKWVRDEIRGSIIQSCKSGYVIRSFIVKKRYDQHFDKPSLRVVETERIFIKTSGTFERYYLGSCTQTEDTRWQKGSVDYHGVLYTANLSEIFINTEWMYSGLYEYGRAVRGKEISAVKYLMSYQKEHQIEHMVKMGLTKLVSDVIEDTLKYKTDLKFRQKKIFEVLGLSKEDTRYMQERNLGYDGMEQLKSVRKKGCKITYQQLDQAFEITGNRFCDFLDLLKYGSASRVLKYIQEQAGTKGKDRYVNLIGDWLDYFKNGTKLHYDFTNEFVIFPRNLKERHDTAARLVSEIELDKKKKETNKKYRQVTRIYKETLDRYFFENKYFVIAAPHDGMEIIKEGQELHHCVGQYLERVANKETVILFIRKKEAPELPYYTMEVKGDKMIQCRGKYNASMTDEIMNFVNSFKRKVLEKKEERAEKSKKTAKIKKTA